MRHIPYTQLRNMTHTEVVAWLRAHTYLDPLYDASFKRLVADEAHPERLVHFLNSLLRLEGSEIIREAKVHGTELLLGLGLEKRVNLDIYCKTEKGEPIVVELQRSGTELFKDRMLYYAASAIRSEMRPGTITYRLPKVYVLAIMDFTFAENPQEKYHRIVELKEREGGELFYEKLLFVYIELPNFRKSQEELVTDEDRWLWALRHMGEVSELPGRLEGHPVFRDLFNSAKIVQLESKEIDEMAINIQDEAAYNDGVAWHLNKGRAEGRLEGIQEGLDKKNFEVVQGMLANGLDWTLIEKITHLDLAKFNDLKNRLGSI